MFSFASNIKWKTEINLKLNLNIKHHSLFLRRSPGRPNKHTGQETSSHRWALIDGTFARTETEEDEQSGQKPDLVWTEAVRSEDEDKTSVRGTVWQLSLSRDRGWSSISPWIHIELRFLQKEPSETSPPPASSSSYPPPPPVRDRLKGKRRF